MSKEEQVVQNELRILKHELWARQKHKGQSAVMSTGRIAALEWVIREAFQSVPMICERPIDSITASVVK